MSFKVSVSRYDGVEFKKEYNSITTEYQVESSAWEKKGDSTETLPLKELKKLLFMKLLV